MSAVTMHPTFANVAIPSQGASAAAPSFFARVSQAAATGFARVKAFFATVATRAAQLAMTLRAKVMTLYAANPGLVIAGGLAILIAIVALAVWFFKRNKSEGDQKPSDQRPSQLSSGSGGSS